MGFNFYPKNHREPNKNLRKNFKKNQANFAHKHACAN